MAGPAFSDASDASGASEPTTAVEADRETLVPPGGFFEGQVAVMGRTRIAGTVRGSLRGPGELVLDPGARVEGVIECDVVSSRGAIVGPVVARRRAHLGNGARFEGDLDAPAVAIDDQAVWIGIARVG